MKERQMHELARMWIEGVLVGSPVAKAMGLALQRAEPGLVTITLPYDDRLTTVDRSVHGGMIATLVDVTGAAASASALTAEDGATGGATSHLSVIYHAPADACDLVATGEVVHRTRSSSQTDVSVHDHSGRLVATGQVSSRIFH
jgi:uncharacterized protein (TIGR00369 family)